MVDLELRHKTVHLEGTSEYANSLTVAKLNHLQLALDKVFKTSTADAPKVCLDIGANIGATTLMIDQSMSGGTIHAFEPHPKTFSQLEANITRNKRGSNEITLHQLALGEAEGQVNFRDVDRFNTGNSQLLDGSLAARTQNSITVPMQRLDNIAAVSGEIEIAKIDVEGFELGVLRGGAKSIVNAKAVLLEFNHWCLASLARVLPEDALNEIFDLFEGVHVYDSKQKQFRRLVTGAERWTFLHQNMVVSNVNDLLCTNHVDVIKSLEE